MADRNDNIGTSGRDDSVVNPDSGTDENSGMSGTGSDRDRSDVSGDELDSSRESGRSGSSTQSDEDLESGTSRSGGIGEDNTSNR
jgi:hypothetical protein